MSNKIFKKLLIFFASILIISCSPSEKKIIEKKNIYPLEDIYKAAYQKFEEGSYADSIKLFELVEKDYSYTDWASKASLMRSYIYYETSNYILALANLQRFKKRYSEKKDLPYVEYLMAMCLFEQINFVSLTQENTELALKQFNKIVNEYPTTSYATDSKFKIDLIYDQLAGKEMYLARYYIKRQKWNGALYRLNNVVKNYQSTVYIKEALHRLVEVHYILGNINSAKKYASILGYNYNDSDWYKKSYTVVTGSNILLEKEKQKKTFKEKVKRLFR